jgi:hypothetical protein
MANDGPVDAEIQTLADVLIRNRGRRRTALAPADRKRFDESMQAVHNFALTVGLFATADLELIEAVFEKVVFGFRAHVGMMGWIKSTLRLLRQMDGDLTFSGRLYVEIRERLWVRMQHPSADPAVPSASPKAELPAHLQRLLFDDRLDGDKCSLRQRRHKKSKRLRDMGMCPRGCDVLQLKHLGFHELVISRIMKLTRSTTVNRLLACEDAVRAARVSASSSQHHQILNVKA